MSSIPFVTPVPSSIFTTPIFYANGEPHLGHAYSGIIADIFHRFSQLSGARSLLITGTDEHGQKIATAAQTQQQTPQAFVDTLSQTFQTLWPCLDIEPDIFIRTTADDHRTHIQSVWQRLQQQGDIVAGTYSGDYCVACEQYYPQRDLLDNACCPVHKRPVSHVEEETYLFGLERYRLALLDYYQAHPGVIEPSHFQNTIIEQLKSGPLDALSISRINNQWGIAVPGHPEHTVYVWIDALFSYITAMERGGEDSGAIARTQHILGKDILIFHAVYWPAFLLALRLPLPQKLIVHGWWTIDGEKISKSNPATTVNPQVFAERLTTDGLRYALVRHKPLYRDGNVVLDEFAELINADLLNNLANLVKRNHTLILQNLDGKVTLAEVGELDPECRQFVSTFAPGLARIVDSYQQRDLHRAILDINALLSELNAFFHHRAPWLLRKGQPVAQAKQTCFVVSNFVRELAWLLKPVTTHLCGRILVELNDAPSSVLGHGGFTLQDVEVASADSHWQRL